MNVPTPSQRKQKQEPSRHSEMIPVINLLLILYILFSFSPKNKK